MPVNNRAAAAMLVKYDIKDQVTYVGRGTINILHCFFILKEITDYIFLHQSHTNSATAADLTTYVVEIHTKKCVHLKKNTASILDFSTCVQFDSVFACF